MKHAANMAFLSLLWTLGCSSHSNVGGSTGSLSFQGQASPLSGFSYDTGLEPPTPPAQAELKLSASGTIAVSAEGTVQGGAVVGTAGSGSAALDVEFQLTGHLTVSAGVVDYDGDIPGLSNVSIKAQGSTAFDPFLIGGPSASITAPIPATQLPPVPLGSVPGTLQLAIADGSTLTTTFQGTCLSVKGGMATYQGSASTSGTLNLTATLALDAPISQSFPLPPITATIPATTAAISFGTVTASGASDSQQGECAGSGGADGGSSDDAMAPPGDAATDGGAGHDGGASSDSGAPEDSGSPSDGGSSFFAAATVDGAQLTKSSVTAAADSANCGAGGYAVSVYFTGPGLGPNTRFAMCLNSVSSGCGAAGPPFIQYQPDDGSFDTYFDDGTSTCGLDVAALPPGDITGAFNGTLTDNNMQSVTVALTFSTPLTQ
jgi:hypothetical protein